MKLSPFLCTIFSAAALFQSLPNANAETLWTMDWSGGEVDQPLPKKFSPYLTISRFDPAHKVVVVDEKSPEPNPFPDVKKALLVERGENDKADPVPVVQWSLGEGGKQKGAFEVEFVMRDGGHSKGKMVRFYLRSIQEREGKPQYVNAGHVRVLGGGAVGLMSGGENELRFAKTAVVDGVNKLRIEWDLAKKRGFWATLNGAPVRLKDETANGPSVIPVPEALCTSIGQVTFMLMYPGNKALIGKVTAE